MDIWTQPQVKTSSGLWLLLGVLGMVAVLGYLKSNGPVPALTGWHHDFAIAAEMSRESDKPMLVLFSADWCGPCKVLKRNVLNKPDISEQVRQAFVPVEVDLTNESDDAEQLAGRYGVDAIPTIIMADSEGREIARRTGSLSKTQFLGWIKR